MRFVFILEDDNKLQREMVEAIASLDPNIVVRVFSNLPEFFVWIKDLVANGAGSLATAGRAPEGVKQGPISAQDEHQLVAVVSKIEYLGAKQIPLMQKTRRIFVEKKICTNEDPTAFVLTAFENPDFVPKALEDRILNNVILKPFDRLILAQHLTFAIDGRHPASKYFITNQKAEATAEMLKDVKLSAISEVGFISQSDKEMNRKVKVGKYYGEVFRSTGKASLIAKVYENKKNSDGSFTCGFSFFGLTSIQIQAIRKRVKDIQGDFAFDWKSASQDAVRGARPLGVVLVEESDEIAAEITEVLRKKVRNVELVHYKSYSSFALDLDPTLLDPVKPDKKNEPPKALPPDNNITFVFDGNGTRVVDLIKEKKDPVKIFGTPDSEVRNNMGWWAQIVDPSYMKAWKDWIAKPKDLIFVVSSQNQNYYMRPLTFEKDEKTDLTKVRFVELMPSERNQFLLSKSKIPKITDLILMSSRFFAPSDTEKWTIVNDRFKALAAKLAPGLKTHMMILASKEFNDTELQQFAEYASDLFIKPLEPNYFLQKLKLFFPELVAAKEPIVYATKKHAENVNTARAVTVTEISEAGLVMQYYRTISMGAFREFILWQSEDLTKNKLLATCNYCEETAEKGVFNVHFVFFAINDHFLKSIRIWIRDNYILSKEKT